MTRKQLFAASAIAFGLIIATAGAGLTQPPASNGPAAGAPGAGGRGGGRGGPGAAAGRGGTAAGRGGASPGIDYTQVAAPSFVTYPSSPSGPVLTLKQGKLQGFQRGDVLSFMGIPFAPPPVGNLRWKAPGKPPSWTGVKQAIKPGPDCGLPDPHEDCLYLNVYTPVGFKPGDKMPVLFWIYGGSWRGGSSTGGYGMSHDGLQFAKKGVILVTVAYRLGQAGWFADPAIDAEPGLHDNYGMMDMLAGLQWTKDNITRFGGNPNNITIFGESAGGASVNFLMLAPQSKGMFQKVIAESSFPRAGTTPLEQAEASGTRFEDANKITGTQAQRAAAMRKIPWEQLDHTGAGHPIADGKMLTSENAVDAFKAGKEMKIPYMVGSNSADVLGASFSDEAFDNDDMGGRKDSFVKAYNPNGNLSKPQMMNDRQTDNGNTEPDYSAALNHANNGLPTYTYFFSYLTAADCTNPKIYGAKHTAEIQDVFGTGETDAAGWAISEAMNSYWAAFAKYGDPGAAGGPVWPKFDAKDETFMVFGFNGPQAVPHFLKDRIQWTLAGVGQARAGAGGGRGGGGRGPAAN